MVATLLYINYTKEVQTLDETILSQMRVCSFDLQCPQFHIDFTDYKKQKLYTLYKDDKGLTSYYPIPNSTKNLLVFNLNEKDYRQELQELQNDGYVQFAIVLVVVMILSIIFSMYALYPLRNALALTQEFIKDILHDFNTPLAAIRLNSSMLKYELKENEKLKRIEQATQNILSLQNHLRSYLQNLSVDKESISLVDVIESQIAMLEKNYPNIFFKTQLQDVTLTTHKDAFTRIIDNLLSNAAKYNKQQGSVTIVYHPSTQELQIIDTGKGIKNPKKIFDRFYKEQERGIGIGLHIVKKLCDELNIKITLSSSIGEGSTFTLKLSKLISS